VPNDQPVPDDELELDLADSEAALTPWDPWAAPSVSLSCFGRSPSPPLFLLTLGAMLDMLGHGSAETNREVGGVLVGQFVETPRGPGTRVDDMIIADSAEASLTHVTFTHESWAAIHRQLEQRDDGARIVGWYHTHPGFGPFLSGQDLFIQRNFFANPLHLALVLDPVQHLFAAFGWSSGEISKSGGCYVFTADDQREELRALEETLRYVHEPPKGAFGTISSLFRGGR
jgi:proteasome lid subunit RPN8/RPN11